MVQASAVVCDGLHVVLIPLGDEITTQRVPCDAAKGSSSIMFSTLKISHLRPKIGVFWGHFDVFLGPQMTRCT